MSNLDQKGQERLIQLGKFKYRVSLSFVGSQFLLEVKKSNKRLGQKLYSTVPSWTAMAAEAERIVKSSKEQ